MSMKMLKKSIFLGIVAFIAVVGNLFADIGQVTIEPGKAIIVSSSSTKDAAEELKLHLKLITGIEVPIVKKAVAGAYVFALNPSKIGDNPESCEWKVTTEGVVFKGNVDFAVLDFLEDALNVRWPEEDLKQVSFY